jgi:hypothetical protein
MEPSSGLDEPRPIAAGLLQAIPRYRFIVAVRLSDVEPMNPRGSLEMSIDSSLAIACSLSPGDYAQRQREFRVLFATSLRETRREPTRLHFVLDASTARDADVRALLRREQECCPFFTFLVEAADDAVRVEVLVPDGAEECLDELESWSQ